MNLQLIFDELIKRELIKDSRKDPVNTAMKQYAQMLGFQSAANCPPEAFNLRQKERNQLINNKSTAGLSPYTIRNLRSNVSLVLRLAAAERLIPPPLDSDNSHKNIDGKVKIPKREEWVASPPYMLHHFPEHLQKEWDAYYDWSTRPYAAGRIATIKKRPISMETHKAAAARVGGFFVNIQGMPAENLTLKKLCDKELLEEYTTWYSKKQGKVTTSLFLDLANLKVMATHYLLGLAKREKNPEERQAAITEAQQIVDGIAEIQKGLDKPQAVHDKEPGGIRWLTLEQIEQAGIARYPLHPARIRNMKPSRRNEDNSRIRRRYEGKMQRYALWVGHSLIVRLMVRIPFRQRNIREMLLGKNLYKENGEWVIRLKGDELKVEWRGKVVNELKYPFPKDLVPLLEDYLVNWYPVLVPDIGEKLAVEIARLRSAGHSRVAAEERAKAQLLDPHVYAGRNVFCMRGGKPYDRPLLARVFKFVTFKFAGVSVNPHMMRTIWATEYISDTKDVTGAAYKLGDTPATVLKTYLKLLEERAERDTTNWISAKLSGKPALALAPQAPPAPVHIPGMDMLKQVFELAQTGIPFEEVVGEMLKRAA